MYVTISWRFETMGVLIKGCDRKKRFLSDAQKMVEHLNEIWGDGTHWIVPLNEADDGQVAV